MSKLEDLIELQINIELDKLFIAGYYGNPEYQAEASSSCRAVRMEELEKIQEKEE